MSDEIKVSIFKRSGAKRSPFWQMQYRDPRTGAKFSKSTGTKIRREAERAAAKWEAELRAGAYQTPGSRMPWAQFCELYHDEHLIGLAEGTIDKAAGILERFGRLAGAKTLARVDEQTITRFVAELRSRGRSESTIKSYLAHVKAALNWAADRKLIQSVPKIRMPRRARGGKVMKGRPITTEEFERMLSRVAEVITPPAANVDPEDAPAIVDSWRFLLRGLWLSGLRLNEAMHLHWTDRSLLCVEDLEARQPMLWIPGEHEKGHKDRILPMAPEFAEFLRLVPEGRRRGFVFNPLPRRHHYSGRPAAEYVCRIISRIGERAQVKVSETGGKVKYASSHDLRRSFGERWAARVMPNVLQELMRHESIQTTLGFYVGQNARRTAAILWDVHESGGALGGTLGGSAESDCRKSFGSK